MSKEQSKKRKDKLINKTELWSVFDSEICDKPKMPLECIYRACGNREKCDQRSWHRNGCRTRQKGCGRI